MTDFSKIAEIEIVYRTQIKPVDRPRITCSKEAYQVLSSIWNVDTIELREDFKVILLNRNSRVLGVIHLSQGGMSGTVVDVRHIFASAIKANASAIMLAHNHPSGNLEPSIQDENMTKRCAEIGRLMEIPVYDHIIITSSGFYSFADNGRM
ncbi:MAG: RadC family protein [Flavobacteriales bacterium]|jgi:DNA repair protein RadC